MQRVFAILGTLVLFAVAAALVLAGAMQASASFPGKNETASGKDGQGTVVDFKIIRSVKNDTSVPLRDLPAVATNNGSGSAERAPREPITGQTVEQQSPSVDTVVQRVFGALAMPTTIANFDGLYNHWGYIPPDTTGDVGTHHYVQMVNVGFQVWDKQGNTLYGPANANVLWSGFGGPCQAENAGDPVVLYDTLADRWLMSQFTAESAPYYQCVAISATGDPAGSWHRYAFQSTNPTYFPDYPKFGVWPDGYYNSVNEFPDAGGSFVGTYAFERSEMLTGAAARAIYFRLTSPAGSLLPSDLDGHTPPPAGAPNLFVYYRDNDRSGGGIPDQLPVWSFHADWITPTISSMTVLTTLLTAPFDSTLSPGGIAQPGVPARLATLSDRLMFRFAYRNLGSSEHWVVDHTVDVTSTTHPNYAGVRWYDLIRTGGVSGTLSINQQGTFAPDTLSRWMGSIAMDQAGNISVGYSVSYSETVYPSIRYAGRLATDPLGQLAQGEGILHAGSGSQTNSTPRWGDYSQISVDPADDCTFWYTTEYYNETRDRGWRTRIGSWKFPSCSAAEPTPTNTATPCPITFADVSPTDYFYVPVQYLYCGGIISGYEDNTFRPYNNTTRSQMVKIVVLGFGIPLSTNDTPLFEDVPTSNPFFVFVQTAAEEEIVSGYNCGGPGEPCVPPDNRPYFRPFNLVTRGQLAKIVVVAAVWDLINPITQTFTDVPPTDPFYTFIETAYCHQIISGYADGTFKPGNSATRGQISKIVYLAITGQGSCVEPTAVPTATSTATAIPTVCPGGQMITGTITLSDPTQAGRMARGGFARTCAAPGACTGVASDNTQRRHYDSYTYTNSTGSSQCVTVTVWEYCGNNSIHSAAYRGTFNPEALCTNYAADAGTNGGPWYNYSFSVAAGETYVVVVAENDADIGCNEYRLSVSPCAPVATNTATPVPPTNTATRTNTPGAPTNTNTPGAPTNTNTPGGGPTNTATSTPSGNCTYTFSTATATPYAGVTNDTGNSCDDCASIIALPFPVQFYGATYNSVQAYSNGYLEFSANAQTFAWDGCLPLDTGGQDPAFEQALYIFNDDLRTDTAACTDCGIYTATFGTAPNRVFVVRWHTTFFADETTEANFQAVMTEGSNVISGIYGTSPDSGATVVVGTQFDLMRFAQFACDQGVLTNGTKLNFTPSGCALRP